MSYTHVTAMSKEDGGIGKYLADFLEKRKKKIFKLRPTGIEPATLRSGVESSTIEP